MVTTSSIVENIPFMPVKCTLFQVVSRDSGGSIAVVSTLEHAKALARGANEWPGADYIVASVEATPELMTQRDMVDSVILGAAENIFDVKLEGVEGLQ